MTLEEILGAGIGGVLVLSLIQVSPLKIDPWTAALNVLKWLWRGFCRSLNAEVLEKLETVEAAQKAQCDQLNAHIVMDDQREADRIRERILIFNDELWLGVHHSEEMFVDILMCIDWYEDYCTNHKEYKNSRAVLAIENIKANYGERLEKGDFLRQEVKT